MGKYLDKTGLQYFYGKLKDKFADKTTIENKLNSLTGALTWKGKVDTLPTDFTNYSAGNVIAVGTKEYVCTEVNGVKSWDELGDEGSYLLKTTAESTYLKKADGEVKTANLADGSVTSDKISYLIINKDTKTIPAYWWDRIVASSFSIDKNLVDKFEFIYFIDSMNIIPLQYSESNENLANLIFCSVTKDYENYGATTTYIHRVDVSLEKQSDGTIYVYSIENTNKTLAEVLNYDTQYLSGATIEDSSINGDKIEDLSITKAKLDSEVSGKLESGYSMANEAIQKANTAGSTSESLRTSFIASMRYVELFSDNTDEHKTSNTTAISSYLSVMGSTFHSGELYEIPVTVDGKYGYIFNESKSGEYPYTSLSGFLINNSSYELITIASDGAFSSRSVVSDGSISKSKLSTDVQASLGKADNSLQKGRNEVTISSESDIVVLANSNNYGTVLQVSQSDGKYTHIGGGALTLQNGGTILSANPSGINFYSGGGHESGKIYTVEGDTNLHITSVATPVEDNDAANKVYVDRKVIPILTIDFDETEESISDAIELFLSKNNFTLGDNNQFVFDIQNDWTTLGVSYSRALMGFTGDISNDNNIMNYSYCGVVCADLTTNTPVGYLTVNIVVPTENSESNVKYKIDMLYEGCVSESAVDNMLSNMVGQSTLATSLQAITIYTDNTAEHKAANLANIKAYEDNLKAMGVDVTKNHVIPCEFMYSYVNKGFLIGNIVSNRYDGHMSVDSGNTHEINIDATGSVHTNSVLTQSSTYSALTTTAKQIVPAINEVNAATKNAVTSVVINGETKTPTNGMVDLGTISGGSSDGVKLDNTNHIGSWTVFMNPSAEEFSHTGIEVCDENEDRYTKITPDYLRVNRSASTEYRNGGTIIEGGDIMMYSDDTTNNMVKLQFDNEHISGKSLKVSWVDGSVDNNPVNITNVADPEDPSDVATKRYVDMMIPSDIYRPITVERSLIDLAVNSTVTTATWTSIKNSIGKGLIINGDMTPSTESSMIIYTYGINANVNAKYTKVTSTTSTSYTKQLTSVTVSFMDEDDTYRKITFNSSGKITAKTTKNILDSTAVANQLAQI